ncbi:MAG TPA: HAD-IB family phosphatase [Acidimicrobiales bacterium]|nr:HAD-IB family phosphatase [Acidimicrobiales bacterium]
MPIERELRGKRFFITGATGFLGTALVERILRCLPEAEITVLIRPGRRADASARLAREVIKNDCFDRLRHELGDRFADEVSRRVRAVAGDVGQDGLGLDDEGRAALAAAGVVIHSAATVSFDAPLTQAVEINLLGPSRVAAAIAECGSNAHLIAVSTAYVASTHQGEAKEELLSENPFTLDVPWQDEVAFARRLRDDLQSDSRMADKLKEFSKKARSEVGAAGDHLIASRAERLREEWVSDELVKAGTARALSLGWPDAYPFTKALGEKALVEQWEGKVPITFVRPSIIESAVAEPRPGWIRGFRMAEPIIISYARGLLAEFPGVPEGIIDVIPVDLVVAALLAVAARGPEPGRPKVYHVASGVRNPLHYGRLVENATGFFQRNPLYDDRGQPISVPEWSFPGRGRVQRQLRRADALMTFAEKLITALPIRGRQAQLAARIEDRHAMAKRALGYVELYGAYTETDARYRVDHLLELSEQGDAEDHERFGFDPGVIDWDHYVLEIHLPSVLEHTRVRTKPGRSVVEKRPDRQRRAILSPERHLAVFDLEHTLMSSNVVDTYAWLASRHLPPARRARFVADLARQGPTLLALDRRDRGDFLSSFYRRFEDAPVARLREDSWELFHRQLLTRSFPDGFARVRAHRAAGHRTLLITGALDFIIEPIRPLFDDIVCAEMGVRNGRLTGQLTTLPPIGEARALLLADYAEENALSLEESVAYADSTSDLAMLEAVGFPVAVNPEARLSTIARRRGWHVEHWAKAEGGSHRPLPLGPFDVKAPKAVMGR